MERLDFRGRVGVRTDVRKWQRAKEWREKIHEGKAARVSRVHVDNRGDFTEAPFASGLTLGVVGQQPNGPKTPNYPKLRTEKRKNKREISDMEAVYLLFSIAYNSFTSSILSLLLVFRSLLRPFSAFSSSPPLNEEEEEEALYEGSVWHERKRPVHHSFRYPVRYALIDLDRAKPNILLNHLSAEQARQITATTGPVFFLTIPSSVGYEQNPLSVYYCYEVEGSTQCLKKCIAEVTNTPWGERVSFIFNPDSDLVAKPLHVSPFMDMLGNWKMRANAPGEHLFLTISVEHPELGDYFTATLTAKRVSSTSGAAIFFWLMPQKVAVWIYWQALKLWWKNVPFMQHPRYFNPKYRDEASMRDRKLKCCQAIGQGEDSQFESSSSACLDGINSRDRWCVWRDAQWPWS